ncbi:unnamed protein product [Moneuplotes crassus]|uniref:Uncharacterized protein n=1 Tax=Euplotes crassus TaxID=5936 RepID=A0AAD1XM70_EUPCR|nr:unnamed protein product [Moneuplotes crassus]
MNLYWIEGCYWRISFFGSADKDESKRYISLCHTFSSVVGLLGVICYFERCFSWLIEALIISPSVCFF